MRHSLIPFNLIQLGETLSISSLSLTKVTKCNMFDIYFIDPNRLLKEQLQALLELICILFCCRRTILITISVT